MARADLPERPRRSVPRLDVRGFLRESASAVVRGAVTLLVFWLERRL